MRAIGWVAKTAIAGLIVLAVTALWSRGADGDWLGKAGHGITAGWSHVEDQGPHIVAAVILLVASATVWCILSAPWVYYPDERLSHARILTVMVPLGVALISWAKGALVIPRSLALGGGIAIAVAWLLYPLNSAYADRRWERKQRALAAANEAAQRAAEDRETNAPSLIDRMRRQAQETARRQETPEHGDDANGSANTSSS